MPIRQQAERVAAASRPSGRVRPANADLARTDADGDGMAATPQDQRMRDRNGWLSQPFRPRLASALGDDRGRSLAFADEASAEAEPCDNQRNCECKLFHGTPLHLISPEWAHFTLVWPDN